MSDSNPTDSGPDVEVSGDVAGDVNTGEAPASDSDASDSEDDASE